MKKTFFLFCLCLSGATVAQETIVLPSTFDENQMIVKKIDKDGYFMPVNQIDLSNEGQLQEENIQKPTTEDVGQIIQEVEPQQVKPKKVRRLRAVKRKYGIQKTTFGADTLGKIESPKKPTFKMPTMTKAFEDLKKESVYFEDCNVDDPNCVTYEVDEKGQVISK